MKLKVLKKFRDKNTKELYKVGDVIEADDARAEELLNHEAGLVEEVKVKVSKPKKTTKTKKSSKE